MQSYFMSACTAVFTSRALEGSHLSETTRLGGCPSPANDGVSISYVCLSVELLEDSTSVAHPPGREEKSVGAFPTVRLIVILSS